VAAGVNALEDLSVTTHSMPWFWVLVGGLGVALVSGSRFSPSSVAGAGEFEDAVAWLLPEHVAREHATLMLGVA
jgi:hypothetical protein